MGKVATIIEDRLVSPSPDRNANRIYVYRKLDGPEVSIHFRNLKITLTENEIQKWKEGFRQALEIFKKENYLKNDI